MEASPSIWRRRRRSESVDASAGRPSLLVLRPHDEGPVFADEELAAAIFGLTAHHPATIAACLLPDRLDWLLGEGWDVEETVGRFRAISGRRGRRLGVRGRLWQPQHETLPLASGAAVRAVGLHVVEAPVRAGLVARRQDWHWQVRFPVQWRR